MKNYLKLLLFFFLMISLASCLTTREVRYMQPSENLVINEEGLIPYSNQEYRVTKNDIFRMYVATTPKGDAAQFYSSLNASPSIGGENGGSGGGIGSIGIATGGVGGSTTGGSAVGGNASFYFDGLRVNSKGELNIFGVGKIKAEGRTIEEIQEEIQNEVNKNFLKDKSEVRLTLDGINYYFLGDVEATGLTGAKKSYTNTLTIMEAIAQNGGLPRTIDRTNVLLQRRYPEGFKHVRLDLTKEDIINSQYFWIQNGDMIYFNTRGKSFNGFGKDPIQSLTTGVSVLTTALSIYLLISRL